MTAYHLHLVSDATGETLNSVARACLVQFKGVEPIEHVWSFIRTPGQMEKCLAAIEKSPGPVLFTLVNESLRDKLLSRCQELSLPCLPVLEPMIHHLAAYFGVEISGRPGLQHVLDTEYFQRMDAMNFALAHDDGQLQKDLTKADVILVGVSRTSKTPTCMYLANRGIKAANVPVVLGCPLPQALLDPHGALIVGLTKDPSRLVQVRRNRLRMIAHGHDETDYVDLQSVRQEVAFARRLFQQHAWPVIDVSRRSIEETAATIMTYLSDHRETVEP